MHQKPMWDKLGSVIRETIRPLTDRKGVLLASTYNKIKHGPQIMVMPISDALKRRGYQAGTLPEELKLSVRALLAGSDVQETDDELAAGVRRAPFLVDDAANMKRWFNQQMVHNVNALYVLGTWLFNSNFQDEKRAWGSAHAEIRELVHDQRIHLERTFGS